MKANALSVALLAGAGVVGFNSLAVAQAAGAGQAAVAESLEEVVVTGSRVITNGNASPTPVTVVDAQELLTANPGTIAQALNNLPVFSGSNGQTSNPNPGIGAGGGGNGARASLNLRNLGEARTLVLLDGHRVPPTTSTNVVDADMIPQLLLKRVDVVTGGVSAVYGSDAISGVVNFITDRAFNGLKTEAKFGRSEQHDGDQYSVGIAGGMNLGARAHIEASYEYHDDDGIAFRSSRPNNHLCGMLGNGGTIPYFMSCGVRRFDATFGGLIRSGALNNNQFVAGGGVAPFNPGQAQAVTGLANIAIGGDGAYLDGSMKAALRSHQLFTRLDYDFSDDLHGYVEAAYNQKRNSFYAGWVTIGTSAAIGRDNAFLPAAVRNQIPVAQTSFNFGKFINTNERTNPVVDETQLFVMTGLEGKLGKYSWELGLVHGDAKLDDTHNNNVNNWRLSAALDAVTNASGQVVCYVSTTAAAANFPGCVPINVFGPGSESQQALDYVLDSTRYIAKTVQDEVSASLSGAPFDTWAGPFNTALSVEWRKQSFSSTSGMPPTDPTRCATLGLRAALTNCTTINQEWGISFGNRSKVSQTVTEGAFEFDLPLLKDAGFAKALNLNGAVRYTNYDTSGSSTTWKLGLDWNINDSWRVRGTRSKDIRAPTLNDLFAPSVPTAQNVTDLLLVGVPGATSQSQVPRYEYGNPNLKAEVGNTATFGIVFEPQSLPGFSASLDAYDIRVTDAIMSFSGTDQAIQTVCYNSGGTSPYCGLQTRALGNFSRVPANIVTAWATTVYNIAEVYTWGADLELNYATRIGAHPLVLRGMLTWQPHIVYERPGLSTVDQGGASYGFGGLQASPTKRATLLVRYGFTSQLSADLQTRWRNSLSMIGDPTLATNGVPIPSFWTSNLNVNYRVPAVSGEMDVFVNVQNVFDKLPPPANFYGTAATTGQFGGFAVGDDIIGRYFTAGLRYKF
jgi:outer membrane receptor protein involved in Fe transport